MEHFTNKDTCEADDSNTVLTRYTVRFGGSRERQIPEEPSDRQWIRSLIPSGLVICPFDLFPLSVMYRTVCLYYIDYGRIPSRKLASC